MEKILFEFNEFLSDKIKNINDYNIFYFSDFDGMKLVKRGKVRDIYEVGDYLLIVSTDRISAFDVILPTPIPYKGMILNMLSYFWFRKFDKVIPNHVVSIIPEEYPSVCKPYAEMLKYRSMLVKKMKVYQIECIIRGYLAGSGYEEYTKTGSICGIELPKGLKISSKLPKPIFTPSTKSDIGHDININIEEARKIVGDIIDDIQSKSLEIFKIASNYLESKGIILCDTKFEFGFDNQNKIVLVDEVLTPDSSRFWNKDTYQEGKHQESYDKQFVRDYLKTLNWNKTYPAPILPKNIVEETLKRYYEIFRRIVF
ncbi:MAG: phosphoribosylaminoimidazolesuccinocarboxamide synthase [Brevinematales bacterium]|nr:phosphoribosylaminoimidazolesuccinocarboxamide synthase [Brevinematales bacterium]